jgi:hypothetical protein
MINLPTVLVAFAVGFITDVAWVRWAVCAQPQHNARLRAANWAVVTYGCSVMSAWLVTQNNWAAVAAFATGCWFGTVVGSIRQKH